MQPVGKFKFQRSKFKQNPRSKPHGECRFLVFWGNQDVSAVLMGRASSAGAPVCDRLWALACQLVLRSCFNAFITGFTQSRRQLGAPQGARVAHPQRVRRRGWRLHLIDIWRFPTMGGPPCAARRPQAYRRLPSLLYRGFPNPQTVRLRGTPDVMNGLPIGKSAIQQVGKPAIRTGQMPIRCSPQSRDRRPDQRPGTEPT
jgi:hypothetical protein